MQELMDKSSDGALTPDEKSELDGYVDRECPVGYALPGSCSLKETRFRIPARYSRFVTRGAAKSSHSFSFRAVRTTLRDEVFDAWD
jgi:hypothetical protein